MERDVVLLGAALAVGALAYLAVAAFVWRHRHAVGRRALTVLLLAACAWTLCYLSRSTLPPGTPWWCGAT
jgi:hypothetical protein